MLNTNQAFSLLQKQFLYYFGLVFEILMNIHNVIFCKLCSLGTLNSLSWHLLVVGQEIRSY